MAQAFEIELKLQFDAVDLPALKLATSFENAEPQVQALVATYFDTPDKDLRKAGYCLRVRREDEAYVQTVKAEGAASAGLFVRPEWERPVADGNPVVDRHDPLATVLGVEALAALAPAFTTHVTRRSHVVRQGESVVHCALDTGMVRAGDREAALGEIELELEAGDPATLFAMARRLNEAAPLRLGLLSKSERGYRLLDEAGDTAVKAAGIALHPGMSVSDAFGAIAHGCVRQFRLNEDILLESGGRAPLHQARVGLRRLRSAMSLFKPLIAPDAKGAPIAQGLRDLAAALGEVRDLDVLIPRLADEHRARAEEVRKQAFERAQAALQSTEARGLMLDLAEWLAIGDWRRRPADAALAEGDAAAFASALLERRRKALKRAGKHLAKLDDGARHAVRIKAKKLRYATEFFAGLFPKDKQQKRQAKFARAVAELQNALGKLNDLAVAPAVLTAIGIEAEAPPSAKKRGRLIGNAQDAMDELIDAKRYWR
ncbi:MAG: CHAD domain-containing protein [Sphingobium sp.]